MSQTNKLHFNPAAIFGTSITAKKKNKKIRTMQGPSRVGHGIGIDSTLVKRWKSSDLPIAAVRLGCGRPFWSHSLFDSWNSILEYSNYRTPTPPESRGRQSEEAGSTLSSDMPTYHWHAQQLGMWSLSQRRSGIMSLICHSTLYCRVHGVCREGAEPLSIRTVEDPGSTWTCVVR